MKQHERVPPIPIARGAGVWLYDVDGRRYLDAISSWWVNVFGHANPRINAALSAQLAELEHVMLAGCTHEPVVQLSERLRVLTGGRLGHCFYGSDGASAVEIALKMSFHFWHNNGRSQKNRYVSLAQSYHGETLGALAVTDVPLFKDTYTPLLRTQAQVASPDWRNAHAGEPAQAYAARCARELETYLEAHHGETAAFIVEPLVQGAAGMAMYHRHYLSLARTLCDRYEVHLIADEIMTGCGRTGTFFAYEQADITPDFLCLSKGLTGGYLPLSTVMTSDVIYSAFYDDSATRAFLHSHSYTGNPLACRAALATLNIFEEDAVLGVNQRNASEFTRIADPLAQHPRVKNFRHIGMIWAFDVDTDDKDFARKFCQAALAREVMLRPIGNTVYFMPPYVITTGEMELLVAATSAALEALK